MLRSNEEMLTFIKWKLFALINDGAILAAHLFTGL